MKIIILGAGQVGGSLAENLVAEDHEITLVDVDEERLNQLQERLDLRVVHGPGSYPETLRQAGADQADMVIAVTDSDEANMIACQVAYSIFSTPTKIARIRSPHYFNEKKLFGRDHLPIDVFISPEQLITDSVRQLILHPGALQVLDFADQKVMLVAVQPFYGGAMLGKSVASLSAAVPDIDVKIVAIFRNDRSLPIESSTTIELGDEVFFITATEHVNDVMAVLRRVEKPYKRVMIAGGGNIGSRLAAGLEKNFQVKVIECNKKRCEFLSDHLSSSTILNGDVSDKEMLVNENIENVDVFCAVTNDDEVNIIACLQAKRLGVKQAMALIARSAYVDLIEGGSINIAISPQQATVGSILTHIRRGDVVRVHSLRRGAAEAIEIVAHGDKDSSKVVGRSLAQVDLPEETMIGAIVRDNEVIIPKDDTVIEADDHVILFVADKRHIRVVDRLFEVSVGFF